MTTLDPDLRAHLQAILAMPDDDTARLSTAAGFGTQTPAGREGK